MTLRGGVPCIGCCHCVSLCPRGLGIPYLPAQYNERRFTGGRLAEMVIDVPPGDKRPAACPGFRNCETVCSRQIKGAEALAKFGRRDDFSQSFQSGELFPSQSGEREHTCLRKLLGSTPVIFWKVLEKCAGSQNPSR